MIKLFYPAGPASWIIIETMADSETLLGLCYLVRLTELTRVRLPFGLGIERDVCFRRRFSLRTLAEAARLAGRITEDELECGLFQVPPSR
jgi:hypothetical protein